jgi:alkylated DNA repair dioxygenase AlkB
MKPTMPIYTPNAIANAAEIFDHLWKNLPWEQREAPRKEVFFSDKGEPYTYGEGAYARTYTPNPVWDEICKGIQAQAEAQYGCKFEALFINGYENQHNHLGWHADDSPSIDHSRPILVYSFGAVRELWFKPRPPRVPEGEAAEVVKISLASGSLLEMPAGMQHLDLHRIPKHSAVCGPRISLTFRGLL